MRGNSVYPIGAANLPEEALRELYRKQMHEEEEEEKRRKADLQSQSETNHLVPTVIKYSDLRAMPTERSEEANPTRTDGASNSSPVETAEIRTDGTDSVAETPATSQPIRIISGGLPPMPPKDEETTKTVKDKIVAQGLEDEKNLSKIRLEEVGGATNLSADEVVAKKIEASRAGGVEIKLSDYQKRDAAQAVIKKAITVTNRSDLDGKQWNRLRPSEINYQRFNKRDCKGVDLDRAFMTTFTKCNFDQDCKFPKDLSKLDKKYFLDCTFSVDLIGGLSPADQKIVTSQLGLKLEGRIYKTAAFKDLDHPSSVIKPSSGFRVASVVKESAALE